MLKHKQEEIKRSSARGEFLATKKFAEEKRLPFEFMFSEFVELAIKPCVYCGGKTPGYACNTLIYVNWRRGFCNNNVTVCCWPCKRMLGSGDSTNKNLEHLQQICTYLQTHHLDE